MEFGKYFIETYF